MDKKLFDQAMRVFALWVAGGLVTLVMWLVGSLVLRGFPKDSVTLDWLTGLN